LNGIFINPAMRFARESAVPKNLVKNIIDLGYLPANLSRRSIYKGVRMCKIFIASRPYLCAIKYPKQSPSIFALTATMREIKNPKYSWLAKAPVARRRLFVGMGKINDAKKIKIKSAQYLYSRRNESREEIK